MYHLKFKNLMTGLILVLFLILTGCKTQPPTVVEKEKIVWTYRDSIITRDSVCYIPIERFVYIVPQYDTLVLKSSIAESKTWLDTLNHILKGEIKNTGAIQYKTKYIERVVVNDSIVEIEKPVPYEVEVVKKVIPSWAWISLGFSIIVLALIFIKAYLKFRP